MSRDNFEQYQNEPNFCLMPQRFDMTPKDQRVLRNGAESFQSSPALERLSNYIQIHHISIDQFWQTNRTHASFQDIKGFCDSIGHKLSLADQIDLKTTLFRDSPTISIHDLCSHIEFWMKNSKSLILDLFKNRTQKIVDSINKKNSFSKHHNNANGLNAFSRSSSQPKTTSSTGFGRNRPQSSKNRNANPNMSMESTRKKLARPQSSININRELAQTQPQHMFVNKSKEYLHIQKKREQDIHNQLSQAINKAKNQHEYQLLLKMGEANDLNKEMQNAVNYRAYKNAQGNLKVKVFNLDMPINEINLDQFEREFNNIKKKFNETRKISVWEMLSGHKKEKTSPPDRLTLEKNQSKKAIKKPERQRQLITILTETMNLTNVLKNQLRILKAQGIHKESQ